MRMALRVKTVWFRKEAGARPPAEVATVLASTVWRLADNAVSALSKADYDILTAERGVQVIGEMIAFLVHMADRMVHGRIPEPERAALVQATGTRVAELMAENVRAMVGDDGFDYRANFVEFLNRRSADYATFEFDPARPSFAVMRYLGLAIRERMTAPDQHWVADQVMEFAAPEALGTLKKTMDGFYPPVKART
jgi:hypothetical protein